MSTEDPIKWRDRVLNTKSQSFCGAKAWNATIWLGNGGTTSCHHPPPHAVDVEEVKKNPKALHNTTYKKLVRKQMKEGVRPKECEYCWKIEDLGKDYVSDRYYKSVLYTEPELQQAFDADWQEDFNPIYLEIAFDSNCNFACSYCNPSFSTTWGHDVKKHGPYKQLKSDGAGAFTHNGSWAQPYGVLNKNNPFVEAFWKWWESDLQYSLKQLRVTGGEATMSHDFWKLIEWYENNPDCKVELAVNTNMGIKRNNLQRLTNLSHKSTFSLFTSNESFGPNAEYIRDGLIWEEWIDNIGFALKNGKFNYLHVMMTLNALCLASFDKFHEAMFDLRSKYQTKVFMSYNILRFPSFQSITTLPKHIREECSTYYKNWFNNNKHRMLENEIHGMERAVAYIDEVNEGHYRSTDLESRQHDFVSFYQQYDKRRNKSFEQSFANWPELVKWYKTIEVDKTLPKPELSEGNANHWGKPMYDEVMQQAKDQGLI